jgi:CHAT domain-containing protein
MTMYAKIFRSILCLSTLFIYPATANTPPQTIANTSNHSLLKAAQKLNQQGASFLAAGKPERALAVWKQAHKLYTQIDDAQGKIGTNINQAQALQALGFYRQALLILQSVNAELQNQPDSDLKLRGLMGLGNSLRALRILEQKNSNVDRGINLGSKEVLIQALNIATKLQDRAAVDKINLSLGNTLQLIDKDIIHQSAIETYQKITTDAEPLVRVQAKINLYRVNSRLLRYISSIPDLSPQALSVIADTSQILDSIEPSRNTIYAYIHLAESILEVRKYGRSSQEVTIRVAKLLTTAIEQAITIGDRRGEAQARGSLGHLYEATRQIQSAKKLTQQALVIAESLPAPDLAYRFDWQLGKMMTANNPTDRDLQTATLLYSQAINHLKSLRNDLNAINADLQFSFRDSVEPVYREYVNLLLTDGKDLPEANLIKARDIIESLQVAELENFLRQGCLDTYTIQLDKIDRSAAVIYPIILPDRVVTIASIPGRPLHYHSRKISALAIEKTLSELQVNIQEPNFNSVELAFKQQSKQIYDLLLAPLAGDLIEAQTKTLVFVLDGSLRNLPMSVLYDGKKYLVENYNLALTPGLQLVPPQTTIDRSRSQVLLGGISESRQGQISLPGVKRELNQIARLIPHQILLNERFNSQLIANNLVASNAPIVHFATHGQFSSKAEDTFILTWDNRLNLDRLSTLLQNRGRSNNAIDLLVLSACETATGDRRSTLGLAGIAIRARAKSTIASLWSVSDEATQDLTIDLYQNLVVRNLSKGESLKLAQQTLLKNPKYHAPYYWAPFILVGNWQ